MGSAGLELPSRGHWCGAAAVWAIALLCLAGQAARPAEQPRPGPLDSATAYSLAVRQAGW